MKLRPRGGGRLYLTIRVVIIIRGNVFEVSGTQYLFHIITITHGVLPANIETVPWLLKKLISVFTLLLLL